MTFEGIKGYALSKQRWCYLISSSPSLAFFSLLSYFLSSLPSFFFLFLARSGSVASVSGVALAQQACVAVLWLVYVFVSLSGYV